MGIKVTKGLKKQPMVAKIEHKNPDGSETATEEVVGEPVVTEPAATVSFKMGITHNMGDYNSLRVDVMLSVPCENNEEAINDAFQYAQEWVDQKLTALREEIEGA